MAFKDLIKKLNLSGIGAKVGTAFRGLAQKLPFKRKGAQPGEAELLPPPADQLEPGAPTLSEAGAEHAGSVRSATNEDRTDPGFTPPAEAVKPGFHHALVAKLKAAAAKAGSVFKRKPRTGDATAETVAAGAAGQAGAADSLIQPPEGANAFQRLLFTARQKLALGAAASKAKALELARVVKENFPKNVEDLKKLQPDEIVERFRSLAGGRSLGTYLRLGAAAFAAYFLADTVSLFTDSLIPDPPPVPAPIVHRTDEKSRSVTEYDAITRRNIFSSKNIIPEPESGGNPSMARKTNLPLNLIGTVVLKDETKSIATIEDKSMNMVFPVRIEDIVNDRIQIKKIEHLRVTFVNKSNGQWEYVEIPEDQPTMHLETQRPSGPAKSSGGITQLDESHVQLEQKIIRDGMANLNEVLQQARAIPNFENGMPDGYKILQIVPGSIFEKLGIHNGDVISALNGEPVNDPGKALSLLNDLPNANHVEIGIKRGGRKMTMQYDIR